MMQDWVFHLIYLATLRHIQAMQKCMPLWLGVILVTGVLYFFLHGLKETHRLKLAQ